MSTLTTRIARYSMVLALAAMTTMVFTHPAAAAVPGDMNGDLIVNSSDIIFLVNHVFKSGPAPDPVEVGDADESCTITSGDIIYMVNFVFKSGPVPTIGCPLDPTWVFQVEDYANANNGADVKVYFERAADEDSIDQYRIMMVKSAAAGSFDWNAAEAVDPANYTAVALTGDDIYTLLPVDARDTDGDPIAEGNPYVAFVLSASATDEVIKISGPSAELTLENVAFVTTVAVGLEIASGGLEVDAEGFIYSADFGQSASIPGSTIVRIHPISGVVDTFYMGFPLRGMTGNTIDEEGNFFQSNWRGGTVSKIDTAGVLTTYADGGLVGPVGLAFDEFDTLYCADCNTRQIKKIAPDGFVTVFASDPLFGCPNGLDRDENGNLYMADIGNGRVFKITPAGTVTSIAFLPGAATGHALYRDGTLWASSIGGNRIYQLDTLGNWSTVAGTGLRGHDDGPLETATFSRPNDCFLSNNSDRLYINEGEALSGFNGHPSRIRAIVFAR